MAGPSKYCERNRQVHLDQDLDTRLDMYKIGTVRRAFDRTTIPLYIIYA